MESSPRTRPAAASDKTAYESLRADIAARLRNVCSEWSEEDFNDIVDKVTVIAVKYAVPGTARNPLEEARPEEVA